MSARRALRRADLALAALAATSLLLAAIVTVDALRFHLPLIASGSHPALDGHTVALALLLAAQAVLMWRALASVARQRAVARRVCALPVRELRRVGGHEIRVVADPRPVAFCAGILRPAVYVTDAALARLRPDELRAVVAHEAHHAHRRDPLRLLVAQALADAFAQRRLAVGQHATAELAADAAAVAAAGAAGPLAAAMLRLRDPEPERVDHLLGRPVAAGSGALLACALVATAALAAVAVAIAIAPSDPAVPPLALLALAAPALLTCRRGAPDP